MFWILPPPSCGAGWLVFVLLPWSPASQPSTAVVFSETLETTDHPDFNLCCTDGEKQRENLLSVQLCKKKPAVCFKWDADGFLSHKSQLTGSGGCLAFLCASKNLRVTVFPKNRYYTFHREWLQRYLWADGPSKGFSPCQDRNLMCFLWSPWGLWPVNQVKVSVIARTVQQQLLSKWF